MADGGEEARLGFAGGFGPLPRFDGGLDFPDLVAELLVAVPQAQQMVGQTEPVGQDHDRQGQGRTQERPRHVTHRQGFRAGRTGRGTILTRETCHRLWAMPADSVYSG